MTQFGPTSKQLLKQVNHIEALAFLSIGARVGGSIASFRDSAELCRIHHRAAPLSGVTAAVIHALMACNTRAATGRFKILSVLTGIVKDFRAVRSDYGTDLYGELSQTVCRRTVRGRTFCRGDSRRPRDEKDGAGTQHFHCDSAKSLRLCEKAAS
ncbi:MAG: hypothetical protein IPF53_19275 [Blastocatellia bacterium]|nr:hypothetical protein [Blastocatellia bacterium]